MMEIVTKALFDCLSEEIVLLNEDIKEDAIISSLRHLISEEDVESREDTGRNSRGVQARDQEGGDSDHFLLTRRRAQHPSNRHGSSSITKQRAKKKTNDDERPDLFVTKGQRANQDIPNLIEFKPKKKRRDPFRDENQSKDKDSTKKLNSGYFFTSNIHRSDAEEAQANKNKLSRRKGKGKKGVHTRAEF